MKGTLRSLLHDRAVMDSLLADRAQLRAELEAASGGGRATDWARSCAY